MVEQLLGELARSVGQSLHDIPQEARNVWSKVLTEMPGDARKLAQKTLQELRPKQSNPKSKSKKITPVSDWHFEKTDADAQYTLRGKKNPDSLGLDTGKTYTGYLDINDEGDHLFYWFFESRNDPKTDPVILWMNGGPGCSSATGQFFELGPSFVNSSGQTYLNPNSWNSNASVIFLDQPVGVGYSYEDGDDSKNKKHSKRELPNNTRAAAKHVYKFLKLFFTEFSDFQPLPFHIFTESYGGHYGPGFASEIVKNQLERPNEEPHINLASLGVGNGIFDALHQGPAYYDMACTTKGGIDHPVLDDEVCKGMHDSIGRCQTMMQACYELDTAWVCAPASYYCDQKALGPYMKTGLNPYDIRMQCGDSDLCYDEMGYVDTYLNNPEVQQAVGAEVSNFESCSSDVGNRFALTGDGARPFHHDVAYLLNQGIPVLVYAGDKDFICNWLGNRAWVRQLTGYQIDGKDGHEEFAQTPVVDWTVDGSNAGTLQNVGHFTFLRVFDAGHMVPYDKGPEALAMVNAWLQGDYAFKST